MFLFLVNKRLLFMGVPSGSDCLSERTFLRAIIGELYKMVLVDFCWSTIDGRVTTSAAALDPTKLEDGKYD